VKNEEDDEEIESIKPFPENGEETFQPRLPNEKPICTQCGSVGHIMRECASNPASSHFKRLNQLTQIYDEEQRIIVFPLIITLSSSDVLMSRSGSDRLKEGEVGVSPSIQLNQEVKEIPEKDETNKETEITEVEVNPQIQPNQQIKESKEERETIKETKVIQQKEESSQQIEESNKAAQMMEEVNNFCIFLFLSTILTLQVIGESDKITKTKEKIILIPDNKEMDEDSQNRNQYVNLNKELILNEKKQNIQEIALVPPEPLTIESSSWSIQQILHYLLVLFCPFLVFILAITTDQQSITKAIRPSFIRMYNKEKEGPANPNDGWIYKMNRRFKFIFGTMEASIMLRPNYEKPKDAYASSKWPNKDRTTLNHNTYPNSTILNENVVASGIVQIILLGKETSLFVDPFKSNQPMEFHDGHCEAATESQMNSYQPRAQLRKEVRRPRTRHKAKKPSHLELLHIE